MLILENACDTGAVRKPSIAIVKTIPQGVRQSARLLYRKSPGKRANLIRLALFAAADRQWQLVLWHECVPKIIFLEMFAAH